MMDRRGFMAKIMGVGVAFPLISPNGNITLKHSPSSPDGFDLLAGKDLLMEPSRVYEFVYNEGVWVQM